MSTVFRMFLLLTVTIFLSTSLLTDIVQANSTVQSEGEIETQELKILSLLKNREPERTIQATTVTTQSVATSVNYKNTIDDYHIHEYWFSTNGGTFSVDSQLDQKGIDYLIYELNSEELVVEEDFNTFILPEGSYVFVVMGNSGSALDYDYVLNGPFSSIPDNTLPELNITNWYSHEIRLPKGSSPVFPVEGYFDGYNLEVTVNNDVYPIPSQGNFRWENIVLGNGFNDVMFEAQNVGGNTVTALYHIILPGVSRIYGRDRYWVSSHVYSTLEYWGYGSNTIIIARGDMYPDALSGGPLAAMETAPILLTPTNKLSDRVIMKINDYQPERAIILGGEGSVSTEVESQLEELGVSEIERIGGKDRYAVSASVAEQVVNDSESDTAIIASGEVFPDALSASSIAGTTGMPILLVKSGQVPESIQNFISNHPEIRHFIIVGGPATVKENVVTELKNLSSGANIERITGKDRYDVSINVAKYGMVNYGMDLSTIAFVRGDIFPDALSGAPLANYFGAPILLTTTNTLELKVKNFLESNRGKTDHMYIIGDVGSVSPNTEEQLKSFIK